MRLFGGMDPIRRENDMTWRIAITSRRLWAVLAVAMLLVSMAWTPGVSWAHARVASSTPANGSTVQAGLAEIVIMFNEDVSVDQSTAQLTKADGAQVQSTTGVDRANRKKMTIKPASPLTAGSYIVRWHAVTEDDNGITDGNLNFTVTGTAAENCTTFEETGKKVCGRFLEYWNTHGGLAQQGFPISAEIQEKSATDGKTYTVQYFERAVFEKHPENTAPNDVLLSLLGNFLYKQNYPNGAPNQRASTVNPRKFSETGKTMGGKFREYWEKNGGLAQQGFPISDEFTERSPLDGKEYLVQYFERAVFEYHPENRPPFDVLLSQLGTFRYKAEYETRPQASVKIVDFKFDPATVTVAVGTRVTWTQVGPTVHNTVHKGNPVLWESELMEVPGTMFSYVFDKAGTYDYWCTIHPEMLGKVVVR
jgi:methionine-rich copper-binding protein CopC/plastocyanin